MSNGVKVKKKKKEKTLCSVLLGNWNSVSKAFTKCTFFFLRISFLEIYPKELTEVSKIMVYNYKQHCYLELSKNPKPTQCSKIEKGLNELCLPNRMAYF